jgi:hypothetical protein
MGKKSSGSSDRSSSIAKAGKRHGHINYPAMASAEKIAAQEQGEQQFISPKTLTVQQEITKIEYDKALKAFVSRTRTLTVPTEAVYDEARRRVVVSPRFKEKEK